MEKNKKPMGFAALSPERRAEISRQGGKAAHAQGKAHKWTVEEARYAGQIGGLVSSANRRAAAEGAQ
jgi:hypothetical protein